MDEEERRYAPDGGHYTYNEFHEFYGREDEWHAADPNAQEWAPQGGAGGGGESSSSDSDWRNNTRRNIELKFHKENDYYVWYTYMGNSKQTQKKRIKICRVLFCYTEHLHIHFTYLKRYTPSYTQKNYLKNK